MPWADAYNDPKAVSDLATYRSSWGLPTCNTATKAGCLTVTNQNGATGPLPQNSGTTGWATEESLDVDMVSAVCPSCHIFLVEAKSPAPPTWAPASTPRSTCSTPTTCRTPTAGRRARQGKNDTTFDTKYYKHPGAAIVASAGDAGYGVSYPAASQYVTSVGGISLVQAPGTTRGWTETVWGTALGGEGTGSGCSTFEAKPS